MAANKVLNLPINRFSIEDAAEALGCRPAQVFRMAGAGELPLYIHMKPHTPCHIDSIAMSEGLTIPIDKVMQTLAKGEQVVIHSLEHGANLRLLESKDVYYASWQNAKVMIGGFWRVSSVPFEHFDLYGAETLNHAILTAWHGDESRGCVTIRGANLPAINDARLWVMPEDLSRLSAAGAVPAAKAKTGRQPKSGVTDFIEQLITLLPSQSEQKRAREDRYLIERVERPNNAAIALALRLINTIPDLAKETRPATIYNVIEVMLNPQPPAMGRTTLNGWMKNSQKVADNS